MFIVKEIIYKKSKPHSIIYSLSMWENNLDLILASTFTCRVPGNCSVPGRTKPLHWTDWVVCWQRDIHFVSLGNKICWNAFFQNLLIIIFIFAVGTKPVTVIKMIQIFSQYPFTATLFTIMIQPCQSRVISQNTCCRSEIINSTPLAD